MDAKTILPAACNQFMEAARNPGLYRLVLNETPSCQGGRP